MSLPRIAGLALGYAADLAFGDPRRGHSVGSTGTAGGWNRGHAVTFAVAVAFAVAGAVAIRRRRN